MPQKVVKSLREVQREKSLEHKRDFLAILVYLAAGRELSVEDYLAELTVEEEKRKKPAKMPTSGSFRVWRYKPISGSGGIYLNFAIKTVTLAGGHMHGVEVMKPACRAILTRGWYHPEDPEAFPLVEHIEFKPEIQDDGGLLVTGHILEVSEAALLQAHDFALSLLVPAVQKVDDYKRIHFQLEREVK
jgi:hypothetical protein